LPFAAFVVAIEGLVLALEPVVERAVERAVGPLPPFLLDLLVMPLLHREALYLLFVDHLGPLVAVGEKYLPLFSPKLTEIFLFKLVCLP
jgi:hypothetical protein